MTSPQLLRIAVGFVLIAVEAGIPRGAQGDELATTLEEILDTSEFQHSHWGLLAIDLADGRTLYERNADKMFAPASVTKLFSVATALDELGADYRFVTPVYARGKIDQAGRLSGDLVLVASGDLTLGGRTDAGGHIAFRDVDHTYAGFASNAELTLEDPAAGLKELAHQIASAGVREVTGEILIDDRLFTPAESTGSGPRRLTPILVNDNVLDFTIAPGSEVGAAAKVSWRPHTKAYTVDSSVETIETKGVPRVTIVETSPGRILVRGQLPLGYRSVVLVHEVTQPASFARALFVEALRAEGIRTTASPLVENSPALLPSPQSYAKQKPIAELTSPSFAESAKLILKVSHNLHASTLPLIVAARHDRRTLAEGLQLEHDFLQRLGVDVEALSFGGGAGGDRADYVTPRATVQLLAAMTKHRDFAVYRTALPRLGIDGTLADAVDDDSPAKGKVQAKTGTLLWSNSFQRGTILQSKALAGYVDAADGRKLAFACFLNLVPMKGPGDRERIGRVLGRVAETLHGAK